MRANATTRKVKFSICRISDHSPGGLLDILAEHHGLRGFCKQSCEQDCGMIDAEIQIASEIFGLSWVSERRSKYGASVILQ